MISIITPSYNRGYILFKLYESLRKQSIKEFEWIIIDDGSTDNTQLLSKEWALQAESFVIRYFYQDNGGKHRAVNWGIKMAQYDYCFIVDSDDFLSENAIEHIHTWIQTIDKDSSFAGVSGLKGYIGGGQIGGFPYAKRFQGYVDATNLQRKRLNLGGDKAEVYRTAILRQYPFPDFEGEKFLTEEVVWDAIARDGYKLRWFNKVIYHCEYIDDGLTRMGEKKVIENFEGYTYSTRQRMELHGWLARQFAAGLYVNIAKKSGLNLRQSAERLKIQMLPLIVAYILWGAKNIIKQYICLVKKVLNGSGENL